MKTNALAVNNVCKRFGGLKVIDHLTLAIRSNEIRCIIGPNGAGKTTFFNLITGKIMPDSGNILMEGKDITRLKPYQIVHRGIARKFQVPTVFKNQTIFENLAISVRGHQNFWPLIFGSWSKAETKTKVEEIMKTVNLLGRSNETAGSLSHGERQWLEIGMVLANHPRIMLLDEPTAGMSPQETIETSRIIKNISRQMTTIIIEHDMKFLKTIADFVTVLHQGRVLAEGSFKQIQDNEIVSNVYLGKEI